MEKRRRERRSRVFSQVLATSAGGDRSFLPSPKDPGHKSGSSAISRPSQAGTPRSDVSGGKRAEHAYVLLHGNTDASDSTSSLRNRYQEISSSRRMSPKRRDEIDEDELSRSGPSAPRRSTCRKDRDFPSNRSHSPSVVVEPMVLPSEDADMRPNTHAAVLLGEATSRMRVDDSQDGSDHEMDRHRGRRAGADRGEAPRSKRTPSPRREAGDRRVGAQATPNPAPGISPIPLADEMRAALAEANGRFNEESRQLVSVRGAAQERIAILHSDEKSMSCARPCVIGTSWSTPSSAP